MLKPIEHILNNPNDLPDVPRAVKEYLQSRFNADSVESSFPDEYTLTSGAEKRPVISYISLTGVST